MRDRKTLLGSTVSLEPLSPVSDEYEKHLADSKTVFGGRAQAFFGRGLSEEPLVPIADYGIAGTCYYAVTDGTNVPLGRALPGARTEVYLRKSVAERLQEADELVRSFGFELFVRDGWRSAVTQGAIFEVFLEEFHAAHQDASDSAAREHALRFASDPVFNRNNPATVPLHATGGAVDVTLMLPGSDMPLDLGSAFDETSRRTYTAYFEQHDVGAVARRLRALLNAAMLRAGFTNYPIEWWHFDYGNRMYAAYLDVLDCEAPDDVPAYGYIELPAA